MQHHKYADRHIWSVSLSNRWDEMGTLRTVFLNFHFFIYFDTRTMKKIIVVVISVCLVIACSKSGNSNVLVGSWSLVRFIEQYKNPYSQMVEHDTLWSGATSVEFRKDGGYYFNGTREYSYTVNNDSEFTLIPPGQPPVLNYFTISDSLLKTWRDGVVGEQIKIFNPDQSGEFKMADVELVYTEYIKQ